ncbi:retrovirus-related pol polyprotein from transposon TNT 1-94 [Tanacetum coccineum]
MCMFRKLTVNTEEPKNSEEAMADSAWIEAMQDELHYDKAKVVMIKKDEVQTVIRNKAILVAKGYAQEEGTDFEESFAPVAAFGSSLDFVPIAATQVLSNLPMEMLTSPNAVNRKSTSGWIQFPRPFREDKCLIRRENQCFIVLLSGALFQPHRRRDILSFMSITKRVFKGVEIFDQRGTYCYKDGKEHLKMEMEIPCSNKIKFITACSFSNDSFEDIMKAQVFVIKASATLNIQAFKIKKSVSISFRMTQVHKMAKDHMMMIKDYDWMMISKKLKDHIQINEIKRLRAIHKINLKIEDLKFSIFRGDLP